MKIDIEAVDMIAEKIKLNNGCPIEVLNIFILKEDLYIMVFLF
jgi:hypothetical protein